MKSSVLFASCLVSTLACAGAPDNDLLDAAKLATPQPLRTTTDNGAVEVEAIFWFGCAYCQQLDPLLKSWQEARSDVTVISVPAPLSEVMASHARAHYAQKVLGGDDDLRRATYKFVIDSGGRALGNGEVFSAFMAANGFDRDASREVYFSNFVTDAVRYDFNRLKAYNLTVAPALVINGTYLVTGHSAGGIPQMLSAADEIIDAIEENSVYEGAN